MTPYGLKQRHLQFNPGSHFFDYDTLKFFGEAMSRMKVLKEVAKVKDGSGKEHECYVLSSLQKNHPAGPTRVYHFFDTVTYEHIPS